MSLPRLALAFAFALTLSPAPASGELPAAKPSFDGSALVTAVEVPLRVTNRHGKTISGLEVEDFMVWDEGVRRPVRHVEEIDPRAYEQATVGPGSNSQPSTALRRRFLLLFDLAFTPPTAVLEARKAAQRLALDLLRPMDLAAVATYEGQGRLRLLTPFTTDARLLARAIDALGAPAAKAHDPNSLKSWIFGAEGQRLASARAPSERSAALHEHLDRLAEHAERADRAFAAERVERWSQAFEDLGRALATLPGRKQILYFSSGFDGRLVLGDEQDPQLEEAFIESVERQRSTALRPDAEKLFGRGELRLEVGRMLAGLGRSDTVLQAIDLSGLGDSAAHAVRRGRAAQDGLAYVADGTGGQRFQVGHDLGTALELALQRSASHYVLTFEPPDLPPDGGYRRLRVELRPPHRHGARLDYRQGYYTPRPPAGLPRLERRLLTAERVLSARPKQDFPIEALATAFRDRGEALVPVIVSLPEGVAKSEVAAPTLSVYVYASNSHGEIVDAFAQPVPLSRAGTGHDEVSETERLQVYGELRLEAGPYRLRVVAEHSDGRVGVVEQHLEIPDFDAHGIVLLPPFFRSTEEDIRRIRHRPSGTSSGNPRLYPFTLGEDVFAPAVRPRLRALEAAEVVVIGYHLGAQIPSLRARVLDAEGAPAGMATVDLLERHQRRDVHRVGLRFTPPRLAGGDYWLEIEMSDSLGARRAAARSPFRLVP